jgi:hypothetical protein
VFNGELTQTAHDLRTVEAAPAIDKWKRSRNVLVTSREVFGDDTFQTIELKIVKLQKETISFSRLTRFSRSDGRNWDRFEFVA